MALQPYFLVHTVTHIIHPTKSLIHINMVQQANNHWIKPRSHKHFQYFKSSSTWSLVQTSLHIHIFSTSNHQTNGHWFKLHFSYTSSILQIFTNFTYHQLWLTSHTLSFYINIHQPNLLASLSQAQYTPHHKVLDSTPNTAKTNINHTTIILLTNLVLVACRH